MITEKGRRCDVKGCNGLGIHYGMDNSGGIGDLCLEDFAIYSLEVGRGNIEKPYLDCMYCGTRVYMNAAQFTKTMGFIDNREKKRKLVPKFACPSCSGKGKFLSMAKLSVGKVVFAEVM